MSENRDSYALAETCNHVVTKVVENNEEHEPIHTL